MRRLLVTLAAFASPLAVAPLADAAYAPKLVVQPAANRVAITVSQTMQDDPTARLSIYAPLGVQANLSQAAGTQIGTVRGRINALDLGPPAGVNVDFTGTISTVSAAQAPPTAAACAPGAHDAIWVVTPSAAGVPLEPIPLLVDRITTGLEATFASLRITVCFRPPDVPAGAPGRSPGGARLLEATFTLENVFTIPASFAEMRWTAVFTPYRPGVGQANIPATAQAQSLSRPAPRMTLRARLLPARRGTARRSVRLTGTVPEGSGATVEIFTGQRRLARVRANADGAFSATLRVTRTTTFRAQATAATRDVAPPACTPAIPLPTGGTATCSSVTAAGFTTASSAVRVTVRKPKPRRRR